MSATPASQNTTNTNATGISKNRSKDLPIPGEGAAYELVGNAWGASLGVMGTVADALSKATSSLFVRTSNDDRRTCSGTSPKWRIFF